MIVVTAPTANIGHRVLERLLAGDEAVRVVARDPAKLPTQIRDRVEVVEGSHGDPDVVDRAFAGADSLFWLVPADPKSASVEDAYVGFTHPAAAAIARHGIRRVVVITALGRGLPVAESAGYVTASLAADDLLAATGVDLMEVTNPSFMDNIARQADPIRTKGMFFGPIDSDRTMPTCAVRDIAAVAARLLLDRGWSGRGHAAVLGPEDLSLNDMAAIMSDVLGRPIRYQQIPFEDYEKQFIGRGMSAAMAKTMTDMARAKNDGLDNGEPRTRGDTTPTSFRQWCEEELKPIILG